ncbi:MAG: ribonuclease HII [Firmicutes bacterium]|nr:ribonuclease HII [Bacillota bacterium]
MFDFENKYKNLKYIAGVDEAGRGPLAGPVVCASVIMPMDKIIDNVNDSKKLSPKVREELYAKIVATALCYRISVIDHLTIDEINILNATKKGMTECVNNLKIVPDIVLIDAVKLNLSCKSESIIRGDQLSYSIAAASILAKVYRDRLMEDYDKIYPNYNFKQHKGYCTKLHVENIKKFGVCDIHRRSFLKFLNDYESLDTVLR